MGSAQQDCGSAEIAFEGIGLKKLDTEKITVARAQRHGRSRERVG